MTADRHRAASLLGSSVEPTAARAAFLRRLPAQAFAPTPEDRAAIRVLVGRPALEPGGLGADIATNDALGMAKVEAFAERFWELPPGARRREWQGVHDKFAGDVVVAARLRRLESALDVPAIPEADLSDRTVVLARFAQEQFVDRPAGRVNRRAEFRATASPKRKWVAAVREFRARFPDHFAFDRAFFGPLIGETRTGPQPARPFALRLGEQLTRLAPKDLGDVYTILFAMVFCIMGLVGLLCQFQRPSPSFLPPAHRPPIDASISRNPPP